MKHIFLILLCALLMPFTLHAKDLDDTKIYNFYQTSCPHCHDAINYIDEKYPNIEMEMINIRENKENFELLLKCAKKFNIANGLGTPLICMGNDYIMGWSDEHKKQFDEYVKKFIK